MKEFEEIDDTEELLPRRFWWQWLSALLVIPAGVLVWAIGIGEIISHSLHPWWYSLFWTGFSGALAVLVTALPRGYDRRVRFAAAVAGICVLLFSGMEFWHYLIVGRFRHVCNEGCWHDYRPFSPHGLAVEVDAAPGFRIAEYPPRLCAAHMMYPLCAGVVKTLYPPRDYDNGELTARTPEGCYEMLLNGGIDAIFAPPPTETQLEAAEVRKLTLRVTPLARDAFVFFVNNKNPVSALTLKQIRKIYSGKITRWEDVGAGSGEIKPFQHRRGNCSQRIMESVMGDARLMPPLREKRRGDLGGTVNDVADYRNYPGALGYSYRFFVSGIHRSGEIKLLALDGVAPTGESIRTGRYPIVTDCCLVTVRPRDANIRKIVAFLHSSAGRELIEKSGYVALAAPAPAQADR